MEFSAHQAFAPPPCEANCKEPDLQTALGYVAAVKARYCPANKRVYEEFLHILRAFRDGTMSRPQVCEAIAGLFSADDDLLRGFSIFLPDEEQPSLYSHACVAQLTSGLTSGLDPPPLLCKPHSRVGRRRSSSG